jgi:HNH endonuclease
MTVSAPEPSRIALVNRKGDAVGFALVDQADAERLSRHKWYRTGNYAARWDGRRAILMHREALDAPESREVDHISRDTLDNRRSNLRLVTRAENSQNMPAHRDARSRYRGVSWHKQRQLWCAEVRVRGRRVLCAFFEDEEQAAVAASEARARFMPYSVEPVGEVRR